MLVAFPKIVLEILIERDKQVQYQCLKERKPRDEVEKTSDVRISKLMVAQIELRDVRKCGRYEQCQRSHHTRVYARAY